MEFRKRVDAELPKKDWLAKDTTLLRYCRARNFNPSKTWAMLKEDVEWREPFEGYVYLRNRDFGGAVSYIHTVYFYRLKIHEGGSNPIYSNIY